MWFKLLTLLHLSSVIDRWSLLPFPREALAFEMDDSNETEAAEVHHLTNSIENFNIDKEIKARILAVFKNPFAQGEIHLEDYNNGDDDDLGPSSSSGRLVTTTLLPLQPREDGYRQCGLKKLNEYRKQHSAAPLGMNSWLNMQADTVAEHVLLRQTFVPEVGGRRLGENTYLKRYPSYGPRPPSIKDPIVLDAVDNWYQERYDYDYDNPGLHYADAHNFTNLVWKSSTAVGIGVAEDKEKVLVVAIFYPPQLHLITPDVLRENVLPTDAEKGKDPSRPSDTFKELMKHSDLYF